MSIIFITVLLSSLFVTPSNTNSPSQRYTINNSSLLFSCDDPHLKNEIALLQRKVDEKDHKLSQLQESIQNITRMLSIGIEEQLSSSVEFNEKISVLSNEVLLLQQKVKGNQILLSNLQESVQNITQVLIRNMKISEDITQLNNLLPAIYVGNIPSSPATRCSDIVIRNGNQKYWLSSGTQAEPVQVICNFDVQLPPLSPVSGWQEIANIDLSDPSQSCPPPWRERHIGSKRVCERSTDTAGCESVFFPTNEVPFTKLCGRAIGYALDTVDAFIGSLGDCSGKVCGINDPYVDGLSITYGPLNNRQHIWSLGAQHHGYSRCPCGTQTTYVSPGFVGENYYCESTESFEGYSSMLWEGVGCDNEPTEAACCANPNLPWFCREFDKQIVTDNIEVRICTDEPRTAILDEDIEIDLLKIFIQ